MNTNERSGSYLEACQQVLEDSEREIAMIEAGDVPAEWGLSPEHVPGYLATMKAQRDRMLREIERYG